MNGCLLVHGLTSSPGVLNPVRDVLIKEGYLVEAPLLAGHGGTLDDVANSTWEDWYSSLHSAYEKLRDETDKVYYVGLSMGALLGLKLAADEGWGVRALALISAPMKLPFAAYVKYLLVNYTPLRWVIDSVPKNFKMSVSMPEGREQYRELAFDRMPLAGVRQIVELQNSVRESLKQISNPMLVVHGESDPVAPPWNAGIIKSGSSSDVIEIINYYRSLHVVTLDWDGEDVARRIAEFFKRFS
jgi:carboxylesterase